MSISSMTAVEIGSLIQKRKLSAAEALEAVLCQIDRVEDKIHSYITIDREGAMRQAAEVQKMIDRHVLTGVLAGVPMAVKDNLCVKGAAATCGSKMLENFVPAYTAEAVQNLRNAGAVMIGKTNMDEFAMGSTTETSAFGPTRNPWNPEYAPGGSSGGSCASVAAEECFFALGSDTGGSIRQPSSFCGVTGLKPTYGTVSRYGLIAYGSSLDQIGPVAKDVADCAAVLDVIASYDKKDSTSVHREYGFSEALKEEVRGMRIGVPSDYLKEGLDDEIRDVILKTAALYKEMGAEVQEFDLGYVEYAVPAYYVIASAEASSNLSRFDGAKFGYRAEDYDGLREMYEKTRAEGFGQEVKRRIMLGTFALSSGYYDAYYLKALKVKTLIKQAFDKAFENYDVLLGPVTPSAAPKIGESLKDPLKMYLGDIYTTAVNLVGLPAISVPAGSDSEGMPVGVQLIGDCFQEKKLITAAYALEQSRSSQQASDSEGGTA